MPIDPPMRGYSGQAAEGLETTDRSKGQFAGEKRGLLQKGGDPPDKSQQSLRMTRDWRSKKDTFDDFLSLFLWYPYQLSMMALRSQSGLGVWLCAVHFLL